jgi:hypothetical protein
MFWCSFRLLTAVCGISADSFLASPSCSKNFGSAGRSAQVLSPACVRTELRADRAARGIYRSLRRLGCSADERGNRVRGRRTADEISCVTLRQSELFQLPESNEREAFETGLARAGARSRRGELFSGYRPGAVADACAAIWKCRGAGRGARRRPGGVGQRRTVGIRFAACAGHATCGFADSDFRREKSAGRRGGRFGDGVRLARTAHEKAGDVPRNGWATRDGKVE